MSYFKHPQALVGPKAVIGEGTRVWAFTNIQDGSQIGQGCNICDGCFIEEGVTVGDYVTLKNGIAVFKGITIEDEVFCGANCSFINDRYPRSHRQETWVLEKTFIKRGATLGTNATILCGITIGEYSVVGAGAVVTKSVQPHEIVIGNPAVFKGYACRCGWKLSENLICGCGLSYHFNRQQELTLNE